MHSTMGGQKSALNVQLLLCRYRHKAHSLSFLRGGRWRVVYQLLLDQ